MLFYLCVLSISKVRSLCSRGGEIPMSAHSVRVFKHVSSATTIAPSNHSATFGRNICSADVFLSIGYALRFRPQKSLAFTPYTLQHAQPFSLQPPTCNHQREQSEQKARAPLIELRHIPLWRLFHYSIHILRMPHCIVHHPCPPSIPPLRPSQINRVPSHHFPHEHTIVQIDGIHRASYAELLNILNF